MFNLFVEKQYRGYRIDKFISSNLKDLSRNYIQFLIKNSHVTLDNKVILDSDKILSIGQNVVIHTPELKKIDVKPENIPIDIVFEDDDIIIVNKDYGMPVHSGIGIIGGTLVNALMYHYGDQFSRVGNAIRPGIVHRLDKDTSGLMVVAKNDYAYQTLSDDLRSNEIIRKYKSLVWGVPINQKSVIEKNIVFHRGEKGLFRVSDNTGKTAITEYYVLEKYSNVASMVICKLFTGRTHQIRVHMSYIGHSVIGDKRYGNNKKKIIKYIPKYDIENFSNINRQLLHAYSLELVHPISKERLVFQADIPEDMQLIIDKLKQY